MTACSSGGASPPKNTIQENKKSKNKKCKNSKKRKGFVLCFWPNKKKPPRKCPADHYPWEKSVLVGYNSHGWEDYGVEGENPRRAE